MTIPAFLTLLLTLVAGIADMTRGKVYNWLTYPAIATGLLWGIANGADSLTKSVVGLVGAFVLYYALHRLSGLGAGDVKLMTAVGALKGLSFVLFASFYTLCFGGVVGILMLAWQGRLFPSLKWVFGTLASGAGLPVERTVPEAGLTTLPFAPVIFLGVGYSIWQEAAHGAFVISFVR